MSTIQTINNEYPSTARPKINQNFANLNADKSEMNHTHSGVYQPANSNIQAHIASTANPHAVTKTQVGLSNVDNYATASQVEAEAGAASNKFMTPQRVAQAIAMLTPNAGTTTKTLIPVPSNTRPNDGAGTVVSNAASSTLMRVGQILVPVGMVVNKITYNIGAFTTGGDCNVVLYSENGQTKLLDFTDTIAATGLVTHTLAAPLTLNSGVYYIGYLLNSGTPSFSVSCYRTYNVLYAVSGKPTVEGLITVSSAAPATFAPASDITATIHSTLFARLDN